MSSFDKTVKLACKPKSAPPKAKYLEPILAATWNDDGAVVDVCKALVPRIREPNAVVVLKALIVLHTMIRNGATDKVLSYLSQADVLRLRNVSATNMEGYPVPQNIQAYAYYLDARIRAYKELKHDVVKVQAEANRDMRTSASVEEDGYRQRKGAKPASLPTRSKTIMGRKLRSMTVEKGLLRETKAVQTMIDTLVQCRFYLDDLEDELVITALRMLVKDLLILFQAGNEGVINLLESYFEMSHIDAKSALSIYRHFCRQTEYVVEYLGVAKKLQNLLNVPVPNLKHAPVSLAGALQEYLDDPNFEQNRMEYKANKSAAEKGSKGATNGKKSSSARDTSSEGESSKLSTTQEVSSSTASGSKPSGTQQDVQDFFLSIEETPMFNPQTNGAAFFPQQQPANPFQQMMGNQMQMTGQPQFIQPQHTAMPQSNPFGMLVPQATGHRPFSSYLPQNFVVPQQTAIPQQQSIPQFQQQQFQQQPQFQQQQSLQPQQPQGMNFLQPQATGANPFRQSVLVPQTTGMALFGTGPQQVPDFSQGPQQSVNGGSAQTPFSTNGASSGAFGSQPPPFGQQPAQFSVPPRPASTPLRAGGTTSPPLQPVKTHQTGTRNPFGPVATPIPPVPRPPTLFELSSGVASMSFNQQPTQNPPQGQTQQANQLHAQPTGFNFAASSLNSGPSDMGSVASEFSFSKTGGSASATTPSTGSGFSTTSFAPGSGLPSLGTTTTGSTSAFSDSIFSTLSSQPTGATGISSSSVQTGTLKPQMTGFSGLKPFQPTSSFGASLMGSPLPTIPGSGPTTPSLAGASLNGSAASASSPGINPAATTNVTTSTMMKTPAIPSFLSSPPPGPASAPSSQTTFGGGITPQRTGFVPQSQFGSSLGVGLRPQLTGGGAANPFRASMAANGGSSTPAPPVPAFNASAFGGMPFGGPGSFGSFGSFGGQPQQQTQQQQPQNMASLI